MRLQKTVLCVLMTALAGCGGGGSGGSVAVVPPPVNTTPTITTQAVFPNLSFSQPVALLQAPLDPTRWYVVQKAGLIEVFANDQNAMSASEFLNIQARVDARAEGGLLGIAFDPDYPAVAEVYVSYTRTGSPLVSYVSRFSSFDGGLTLLPSSEEVILTVDQPDDNHNGGDLAFGPDGFLYVGFGDGGGSGDPGGNGQDNTNLMGAIIRIDVDGGSPYGIAAGNPFEANPVCASAGGMDPCPEIFAWGLRNPWRFSFDISTGKLWAGDVGQGAWEEIDVIISGGNYGWNTREGAHCFNPATGCADTFVEPITEYDRSLGRSVTGGYVYRGAAIPNLVGWYVFGDFVSGRLFGVQENSTTGTAAVDFGQTSSSIVSFGQDTNGELYVLDFSAGNIHQIVDAP